METIHFFHFHLLVPFHFFWHRKTELIDKVLLLRLIFTVIVFWELVSKKKFQHFAFLLEILQFPPPRLQSPSRVAELRANLKFVKIAAADSSLLNAMEFRDNRWDVDVSSLSIDHCLGECLVGFGRNTGAGGWSHGGGKSRSKLDLILPEK